MRRTLLRAGLVVLAVAIVLAAGAGTALWLMTLKFNPAPPPADYPKPGSALEAQRQDIDYFSKLVGLDRSFSNSARARASRAIAALEAAKEVLPQPKLRVALMKILAMADNGHTRLSADDTLQPKTLPIGAVLFSDGLYILRARADYADVLGARVVAIDHSPVEAVLAQLEQLRGGSFQWREFAASNLIVLQDILYGDGISSDPDRSTWTLEKIDGSKINHEIVAYRPSPKDPNYNSLRWLSPEPAPGFANWHAFAPPVIPPSLHDYDQTFRRFRVPDSCTMFIQFKSNVDEGKERISDFVDATEDDMEARPPCNVILDLRFDGGGDYTNTYSFAKSLTRRLQPPGRIFVLTGPVTFSAGITTTGAVKEAGGARVTILGENVGDRLSFYSEGGRGCLPHAHLCVNYQTGKHDYTHPCSDWNRCYWLNWLYPVRVATLAPDETIQMSFSDWSRGRDTVFDRAVQLAARSR